MEQAFSMCLYLMTSVMSSMGLPVTVVQPVCILQPSGFNRVAPKTGTIRPKKGLLYTSHEPSFEEWKEWERCDPAATLTMSGQDKFKRVREYDCNGNLLYITIYHGGTQLFSVTAGPEPDVTAQAEEAVDELLFESWKVSTLQDDVEVPKECRKLSI